MEDRPEFLDRVRQHYTRGAQKIQDTMFAEPGWPHMVKLSDRLEAWLEAQPPQTILDLACGTGAPTVALALKGYSVTGLDLTPAMLDIARKGAAAKGAALTWICGDMRSIDYQEVFDHVMLRDVIFGVLETRQEDADLIRRMAIATKTGGRCLFEVYNKQFAMLHGIEGTLFYDASRDAFVPRDEKVDFAEMRLYCMEEWEQMLGHCGLRILKLDGWKWKKDPEPPPWRADIIVAQKC